AGRPEVDRDDHALVAARRPQRVPAVGVEARQVERRRVLGGGDGVHALGGQAPDLGGRQLRVPERHDAHGDEPAGGGPAPLPAAPNTRPEKDGNDGKHIEARMPPALMSLTRSWTSQHPGRISSNAVGSMPYSSLGRPATALSPMLGIVWPLKTQTSEPSSVRST